MPKNRCQPVFNGAPSLVRAIFKEDSSVIRHDYRKKAARTKLGAPLHSGAIQPSPFQPRNYLETWISSVRD